MQQMDESGGHDYEWKNLDQKDKVFHDSIYIKF